MQRTMWGLIAGTTAFMAVVALAAGWLGRSLAGCYVEWMPIPERPLCGPGVWGAEWVPLTVLIACGFALAVSVTTGLLAMRRQFGTAARYRRRLVAAESPQAPGQVERGARLAGIVDVRCVATDMPLAVTIGVWQPRIVVSTGLADLLTTEELAAVLRHEGAHRRGHHPALYGIARTASAAFPIPALQAAARTVVLAAEVAADKAATDVGGVRPLVSALLKISQCERPPHGIAMGSIDGMLEHRLRALKGDGTRLRPSAGGRILSGAAIALACLPLVTVVAAYLRAMGRL